MLNTTKEKLKQMKLALSKETPKKYFFIFTIIIALTLICELFVFNFKWIDSTFDKELTASFENMTSGFSKINDRQLKVNGDLATIEFNNVNRNIKYLRFSMEGNKNTLATITVSAIDEANSNYLSAPQRTVFSDVNASQYIRLHFSGDVKNLKIAVKGMDGKVITPDSIGLNSRVPLMFSWGRFIFMCLLVMTLFVLRPKSSVYKYKTDLTKTWQKVVVIALIIIQSVAFFNMIHWNTVFLNPQSKYPWHAQYAQLSDAFKHGRLYISDEVSDSLKNLDNPYDLSERTANNAEYRWDTAYYKGKYYCYFGALPALILYLPYNLITGNDLPNYIAAYIFGVMSIIGILVLLWEIIKKWYKNTPFALYLVLSVVFSSISGIVSIIYTPVFYIIPIISALMFAVWGLAFWISAEQKNKSGEDRLSPLRLSLGSLFVALTAGCRPQFLLTAVLGVVLFWNCAFKKHSLFSKNSIKQTTAVCLPFVIVGALVMWYNFARFGSPFDFGANYNLTSNDMTHRGFVFGRIGLGIFTYLFQPFRMNSIFPFIHDFYSETVYQGLTLAEKLMGGVLSLYPYLLIGVFGITQKKLFDDKRAYRIIYITIIMSVIIAIMDAQMAGLLTRYFNDFVWLIALASTITAFALYNKYMNNDSAKRNVITITLVLSVTTLVIAFLSIFAHTENPILATNPQVYYTIQHLIAFWM